MTPRTRLVTALVRYSSKLNVNYLRPIPVKEFITAVLSTTQKAAKLTAEQQALHSPEQLTILTAKS